MKKILGFLVVGIIGGLVALGLHSIFFKPTSQPLGSDNTERALAFASLKAQSEKAGSLDFVKAAELSTPSVVHIRTQVESRSSSSSSNRAPFHEFFDFFGENGFDFDMPRGPRGGSGSGVIITADGFIATNNHVVEGASKIEVTLHDKRTYVADLIGTDPTTDLALLKIKESGLPFLPAGNSDALHVGEWVIAVGNPMNLNSTVTAGIISAKERSINLLRSNDNRYAIENFIQTDAAINPGNSGGALVNTAGELIGINTAIASQTGGFIGYGFAIPINLAKKVLDDIKEFGGVQRGLLGVSIQDITSELAEKENINSLQGVYVFEVVPNSAADKAGMKAKDIIRKVNGRVVNSSSSLQEEVGKFRPGDKITLTLLRGAKEMDVTAILLNKEGKASTSKVETVAKNEIYGLVLENLERKELEKVKATHGVRVKETKKGIFQGKIPAGFIITSIDKKAVHSVSNVVSVLQNAKGGVLIEGRNNKGEVEVIGVLID